MSETGNLYRVVRPEDGAVVNLTCTKEQLESVWIPAGYQIAQEAESAEPERTSKPAKGR